MKLSFLKIALSVGALASNGCSATGTGTADVRDSGTESYDSLNEHASFAEVRPSTQNFLMIDDMDRLNVEYPPTPLPSSFFWSSPSSPGLGNWFVTSATGKTEDGRLEAIVPPRGKSTKAIHMKGSGLENGRNLWVQLDHPQGRPANLGAYLGISFWARLNSTDSKLMVAMDDQGGSEFFKTSRTASHRTVGMSDQWERYVLLFQDFGIDGSKIAASDFVPVANTAPFDLWIDDLSLLCRGGCE